MKRAIALLVLTVVAGVAAARDDSPTTPTTTTSTPETDAPTTVLTASHIHPGAAGTNGGVVVSLGLTAGEVTCPVGSGSFSNRDVILTVDQANAIMVNPGGFYLNIHTAANPNGVGRGQLARS